MRIGRRDFTREDRRSTSRFARENDAKLGYPLPNRRGQASHFDIGVLQLGFAREHGCTQCWQS